MATTSSIIALGTTLNRKTAAVVSVDAGQVKTVGIYVASGQIPSDVMAYVTQVTPGAPVRYCRLTADNPAVSLGSPGDYDVCIDSVGSHGIQVGAFKAV